MKKGFTLVELLIVISIIGILAASSVLGFAQQQKKARDSRRVTDVSTVGVSLESYFLVHNEYPGAKPNIIEATGGRHIPLGDLTELVSDGLIASLPRDPSPATGSTNHAFIKICDGYYYASPTGAGPVGNTTGSHWGIWFGAETTNLSSQESAVTTYSKTCDNKRTFAAIYSLPL